MLDISPKRQLLLLFSFYCFSNILGSLMGTTLLKFTSGQVSKLSLSSISIFSFFVPAFIAFKLFSKEKLISYWGLDVSFSSRSFFITILIMICCIIIMNWLAEVNKWIPLFNWMKEDEIKATSKLRQYLEMANLRQLLLNLLIFSFVASFCEEVFFRGTMQPMWYKLCSKAWIGIFITAFIFSFLHFQFLGFLPRLLAGIVFGGIYYYTGSLWLSVISHILYNGSIVVLNYISQHNQVNITSFGNLLLSPFLIISAALMMSILFYQLQRDTFRKRNSNGD